MSKGSGSEKSQGTLECQGEWELKARQSGHQDLGICGWLSGLRWHRNSLRKEGSPGEWFPRLLKGQSTIRGVALQGSYRSSLRSNHTPGSKNDPTESTEPCHPIPMGCPSHLLLPHKAAAFDIGWVAALRSVERVLFFSHSAIRQGPHHSGR